ncbi:6-carboxyhexanoate--CoA ligase [Virgibacillus dokdonensis]|uniref:6-carboxyhexanoate--CoA ligase n=1 Tax=Virgibacillus dokdonensis TaxID=302167 RepID=UPI001131634A|nr:6-carboxyhexanoate--CoA ligase [Virgibacillus dokdonensis]
MVVDKLYNLRMRAAQGGSHEQGGTHISGGERIARFSNIQQVAMYLLEKGLTHCKGRPDFMQIQLESIPESVTYVQPLERWTNVERFVRERDTFLKEGKTVAFQLLEIIGLPKKVIDRAVKTVSQYSSMRGAVLIDAHSGKRLDDREEKGVRVSRLDWRGNDFEKWVRYHHVSANSRIREALALAAKVNNHPATIAELCWSDDPDYTTGYVASRKMGYQRIENIKAYGDERGCRIFFVDGQKDIRSYINYLENQPVLITWEG